MSELKDLEEIYKDLLHYRWGPIWDGNVNSKWLRDRSVDEGLIVRSHGFQILTPKGVEYLVENRHLNESTWRQHPTMKIKNTGFWQRLFRRTRNTGYPPVSQKEE